MADKLTVAILLLDEETLHIFSEPTLKCFAEGTNVSSPGTANTPQAFILPC